MKNKSFSLIELLFVILIISILVCITLSYGLDFYEKIKGLFG